MRKILLSCLGLWLASAGLALAQSGSAFDPGRAGTALPYMGVVPGTLLWADPEPTPHAKKRSIWPVLRRKHSAPALTNTASPANPPNQSTGEESEAAPATEVAPAAPPAPVAKALPAALAPSSAPAEAAAPPGPAAPLAASVPNQVAGNTDAQAPLVIWGPQKRPGPWWVSTDYMFRWLKRGSVPGPLLVSGPASANGIAGAPGTTAFGNNSSFLNNGPFSGVQMTAGRQLGNGPFGLEVGGFMLEQRSTGQQAGSDAAGNPAITLPIVNASTASSDRFLAAFPGFYAGSATISSSARLWGGDANLSRTVFSNCHCYAQLLAGVRYLNLQEQMGVQSISVDLPPNGFGSFNGTLLPPNSVVTTADNFSTQNNFYGGQVGGRLEWRYKAFFVQSTGKVALGLTDEIVAINGFSSALPPGAAAPMTAPGGLYALPSNIGRSNRSEFAVVPEFALTFGVQLTQRLRVYAGYNFLYWSSVARPGSQINPVVNLAQPPLSSQFGPAMSPTQPLSVFHSTDFWAQGVDIGMAFRF